MNLYDCTPKLVPSALAAGLITLPIVNMWAWDDFNARHADICVNYEPEFGLMPGDAETKYLVDNWLVLARDIGRLRRERPRQRFHLFTVVKPDSGTAEHADERWRGLALAMVDGAWRSTCQVVQSQGLLREFASVIVPVYSAGGVSLDVFRERTRRSIARAKMLGNAITLIVEPWRGDSAGANAGQIVPEDEVRVIFDLARQMGCSVALFCYGSIACAIAQAQAMASKQPVPETVISTFDELSQTPLWRVFNEERLRGLSTVAPVAPAPDSKVKV